MTKPCGRCGTTMEIPLSNGNMRGIWGRCPACGQLMHFRFNGGGRLKKITCPRKIPDGATLMELKVSENNSVNVAM